MNLETLEKGIAIQAKIKHYKDKLELLNNGNFDSIMINSMYDKSKGFYVSDDISLQKSIYNVMDEYYKNQIDRLKKVLEVL